MTDLTVYSDIKNQVNIASNVTGYDEIDLVNDFFVDCFKQWCKKFMKEEEYERYLNATEGVFHW